MIIEISFMMMELEENRYRGEFSLFHKETGQKRIFTFSYCDDPICRKIVIRLRGRTFLDASSVKSLKGNQRNLIRLICKPFRAMLTNLKIEKQDYSDEAVEFFQRLGIPLDFRVEDEYDIEVEGSERHCIMQIFEDTR